MCQQSYDGNTVSSTCFEQEPHIYSRLAQSLKRGHFAQTFGEHHVIGRGGYGTVLKAWHLNEEKWYAVKVIPAKIRASETIEENCEAWCGPEIFRQLMTLRSSHVVNYIQYWSELPSDVPHNAECCHSRPCTPIAAASSVYPECPHTTSDCEGGWTAAQSDGGFEWASSPIANQKITEEADLEEASTRPNTSVSPKHFHYKVLILEQMEFCEGITLATWLSSPELRPRLSTSTHDNIDLFSQVMKGLCDLHDVGIVHCDIKPANILVTIPDAHVKIFDFGTAKNQASVVYRSGSRAPLSPHDQRGAMTALGTPGYAPPEHCVFRSPTPLLRQYSDGTDSLRSEPSRSKVASPSADIFSAGVILLELLMATVMGGAAWLTSMERAEALAKVRSGFGGALPLEVLRTPNIEGWLRQLVLRMVVWDAEVRPSAREVLGELGAGIRAASRNNPNLCTQHPRSLRLEYMKYPLSAARNPYIGYFVEHRPVRQLLK